VPGLAARYHEAAFVGLRTRVESHPAAARRQRQLVASSTPIGSPPSMNVDVVADGVTLKCRCRLAVDLQELGVAVVDRLEASTVTRRRNAMTLASGCR